MGNTKTKQAKVQRKESEESALVKALSMTHTKLKGLEINQSRTNKVFTRRELERIRENPNLSPDVRIITHPPFSQVDRITDCLYLTGVAGITKENLAKLNIRCIINATHEMPLITNYRNIESWRVPVDDDPDEDIFEYLDEVATKIHEISKKNDGLGNRTIVHCMAGASRSSTLVIAYLIKYKEYSLKSAFCYLKSLRACARPNLGFFYQLVQFEEFYRGKASTQIVEFKTQGRTIYMPDFYKAKFPDLYKAELIKQMNRSHVSRIVLQGSNKNYINRKRDYKEMQKDIEKLQDPDSTDGSKRDEKEKKNKDESQR